MAAPADPISGQSQRRRYERRKEALKAIRQPWEAQWMELAQFTAPTRYRATQTQNEGTRPKSRIVDSTGSFALRTLASGMHSGITSPARPWFRLTTFDPEMRDFAPVRQYLSDVENIMREVFQGSNIYNAFHYGYGDLGLFGQSCGILVEDEHRMMRIIQLQHGGFWLARDHRGIATTLCREFSWSVERIVARFGYDKCSLQVRQCYDRGDYDERFTINHMIEPRHDRQPGKIDKRNKPWASCYWEEGARALGDRDKMLEESGFDENPIIAPPWELVAEDHYANSPGMDALPDVKALQIMESRSQEAVDKMVRPPMTGPVSMKNDGASLLPGAVNYVDDPTGKGFRAAIEVRASVAEMEGKAEKKRQMIERAYYADLFLMLSNMEGIQPRNQFEIAERKEEKLLALGPVLENIYGGQLAPTIDRAFAMLARANRLPPPPQEVQGQNLKIEYISMLAQAQKAVSTGAIDRTMLFATSLAAVNPTVLDKVDLDEAIDQYSDAVGVAPSIIVSDDKVKAMRQARQAAEQKAAQAEQAAVVAPAMKQGAEAAQILSQTDASSSGSLLAKLGIG
jgi:hypothetical protein